MELNKIFFRPPQATYSKADFVNMDRFFEVPTQNVNGKSKEQLKIPCLMMPFLINKEIISKYYIVYFHGNAEDLGTSHEFLSDLRTVLRCNIILTEYCGYGVYKQLQPNCKQIEHDSVEIFKYINEVLGIPRSNIILLGRSMGSGPACMLASQFQPRGLMLISAFTSLKDVAKNMVGVLSSLVCNRFKNIEWIESVRCPVLLIHGKNDKLVPCSHSQQLADKLLAEVTECYQDNMTHNEYDFDVDITYNIQTFMRDKMNIFQKKNDPILSKFENFPSKNFLLIYPELAPKPPAVEITNKQDQKNDKPVAEGVVPNQVNQLSNNGQQNIQLNQNEFAPPPILTTIPSLNLLNQVHNRNISIDPTAITSQRIEERAITERTEQLNTESNNSTRHILLPQSPMQIGQLGASQEITEDPQTIFSPIRVEQIPQNQQNI